MPLKTFRDNEAGISISFPTTWVEIENNARSKLSNDQGSQIRLVAGPARDDAILKVRVVPLDREIVLNNQTSRDELTAIQNDLDQLIVGPNVKVLDRKILSVNGLVSWFYLYQFVDEGTGREGAHSHYFLFDGAKMNAIVLEALPRTKFTKLAPVFDQIVESFKSVRRPAPAPAASPGQ